MPSALVEGTTAGNAAPHASQTVALSGCFALHAGHARVFTPRSPCCRFRDGTSCATWPTNPPSRRPCRPSRSRNRGSVPRSPLPSWASSAERCWSRRCLLLEGNQSVGECRGAAEHGRCRLAAHRLTVYEHRYHQKVLIGDWGLGSGYG